MNDETKAAPRAPAAWPPVSDWMHIKVSCSLGGFDFRYHARRLNDPRFRDVFVCDNGELRTYFQAFKSRQSDLPAIRDVTVWVAIALAAKLEKIEILVLFGGQQAGGPIFTIEDVNSEE